MIVSFSYIYLCSETTITTMMFTSGKSTFQEVTTKHNDGTLDMEAKVISYLAPLLVLLMLLVLLLHFIIVRVDRKKRKCNSLWYYSIHKVTSNLLILLTKWVSWSVTFQFWSATNIQCPHICAQIIISFWRIDEKCEDWFLLISDFPWYILSSSW